MSSKASDSLGSSRHRRRRLPVSALRSRLQRHHSRGQTESERGRSGPAAEIGQGTFGSSEQHRFLSLPSFFTTMLHRNCSRLEIIAFHSLLMIYIEVLLLLELIS